MDIAHNIQTFLARTQVEDEQTLDWPITPTTKVEIQPDSVSFEIDGRRIGSRIDNTTALKLNRQLGETLFPSEDDELIRRLWQRTLNEADHNLGDKLRDALVEQGKRVRFLPKANRNDELLGVVRKNFKALSNYDFRHEIIHSLALCKANLNLQNPNAVLASGQVASNRYAEQFSFMSRSHRKSEGSQIGFSINVHYGRNDGYSPCSVSFYMIVLTCMNGTTDLQALSPRCKYYSTETSSILRFTRDVLAEGYIKQTNLHRAVEKSIKRKLKHDAAFYIIGRLFVASSVKSRVVNQLGSEILSCGENEFALSQALTYVATHDGAVPELSKDRLRYIGTKVLVDGADSIVHDCKQNFALMPV